jgi:hypothetical protein
MDAQRGRRLDAVLPAVPCRAEHDRDLPEIVDEKLLRVLAELVALAARAERFAREQLLEFLRERRLRDAPVPDTKQLDFAVER